MVIKKRLISGQHGISVAFFDTAVADMNAPGSEVFGDDRTGSDGGAFTDGDAGKHDTVGANDAELADGDGCAGGVSILFRDGGVAESPVLEVVGSGQDAAALGDGGEVADVQLGPAGDGGEAGDVHMVANAHRAGRVDEGEVIDDDVFAKFDVLHPDDLGEGEGLHAGDVGGFS